MKTLLRALILILIVLWLGGVMFFPIVAATAFSTLSDTHLAGTIVAKCLKILHFEGLFSGAFLIILLFFAHHFRIYTRNIASKVLLTVLMVTLTALLQFGIMPKMESYRLAAGGAINAAAADDPNRIAFNRLHVLSERVEEGVLVAGLVLVVFIARE
jgi:hypothetical protein